MKTNFALSLLALASTTSTAAAQATYYLTHSTPAGPVLDGSPVHQELSASGRYVVFDSASPTLGGSGQAFRYDIFRHDLTTRETVLVSVNAAGTGHANGSSQRPSVSADGRFVAWSSAASDLVSSPVTGLHVYLRDMQTGVTIQVDDVPGATGNGASLIPTLSADGRYVVFRSTFPLDPADTNLINDFYRYDIAAGTLDVVTQTAAGVFANHQSTHFASVSNDGRLVAFASRADNFAPGDTGGFYDVFVKDMVTGALERISELPNGVGAAGDSLHVAISGDGSTVSFISEASNLVAGDTNGLADAFVVDLASGSIEAVSVKPSGAFAARGAIPDQTGLNADGTIVVFLSTAPDLVPGPNSIFSTIFLRDRVSGETIRASTSHQGQPVRQCQGACVSDDGQKVSFRSTADSIIPGVTPPTGGVYLPYVVDRARIGVAGESYCDPEQNSSGRAGVIGLSGSTSVAQGQLRVNAKQLPPFSTCMFIVSRTRGFVPNVGGSAGNLCLGGSIGRYNHPSQIRWTGPLGTASLSIDLMGIPQGPGPVPAQPGDTWHFQLWSRDIQQGVATSTFSNGVAVELR